MPRISEKSEALQAVSTSIESTIFICPIESSSEEEEDLEDDSEDLAIIYDVITSQRYLASRDCIAGRHADDSLEAYIRQYPKTAFLALFVCIVYHSGTL